MTARPGWKNCRFPAWLPAGQVLPWHPEMGAFGAACCLPISPMGRFNGSLRERSWIRNSPERESARRTARAAHAVYKDRLALARGVGDLGVGDIALGLAARWEREGVGAAGVDEGVGDVVD